MSEVVPYAITAVTAMIGIAARLWRRRAPIKTGPIRYVIDAARFAIERITAPFLAGHLAMRSYGKRRLAATPAKLVVPGVRPRVLDIDDHYVSLRLRDQKSHTWSDTELLNTRMSFAILGEPGAGKSSLAVWLQRRLSALCVQSPKQARLPIFIDLRKVEVPNDVVDSELGAWFVSHLDSAVKRVPTYGTDQLFRTMSRNTGVVVVADGLDEVPVSEIPRIGTMVSEAVSQLRDLSEKNSLFLLSRPQALALCDRSISSVFDDVLTIDRLSETAVEEFVRAYPYIAGAPATPRLVLEQLTANSSIAELARNPLVLSMYVAHSDSTTALGSAALQETRTGFMRVIMDELLFLRRRGQVGHRYGQLALKERREQVLGRVAADHLASSEQTLNSIPSLSVFDAAVRIAPGSPPDDVISDIAVNSGVIEFEQGGETARFMHESMLQYCAGLELSRDNERWTTTLAIATEPAHLLRIQDSLVIAVAMTPRARRNLLLHDLLELRHPKLVIAAAIEAQHFDSPSVTTAIDYCVSDLARNMFNPSDNDLQDLLWLSGAIADAHRVAEALGRTSPLTQGTEVAAMLASYASSGASDVEAVFAALTLRNFPLALEFASAHLPDDTDRANMVAIASPSPQLVAEGLRRITDEVDAFWCTTLTRAALQRRSVAEDLIGEPPMTHLANSCAELPRRLRWDQAEGLRSSLYGQLVALAASHARFTPATSNDGQRTYSWRFFTGAHGWLPLLRATRPRRRRISELAYYLLRWDVFSSAIIVATVLVLRKTWSSHWTLLTVALLAGLHIGFIAAHGLVDLYQHKSPTFQLFNLTDHAEDVPECRLRLRLPEAVVSAIPVEQHTVRREPARPFVNKWKMRDLGSLLAIPLFLPLLVLLFFSRRPIGSWAKTVDIILGQRATGSAVRIVKRSKTILLIEIQFPPMTGK